MKKPFMRRRELKGFKDFKTLDNYIQNCLDLYKIMSPLQEYYDIAGKYSKYIISNKSTIPDLVIYNTKFNKNDCFYDYYGKNYNDFPRVKFILNSKSSKNKIKKKKEEINLNLNDNTKRVGNFTSDAKITCDKKIFDSFVDVEFEKKKYKAPVGYDAWLKDCLKNK